MGAAVGFVIAGISMLFAVSWKISPIKRETKTQEQGSVQIY